MSRGNYFFEKTRNSSDVKEITLKFGDKNKISIVMHNGLWRIKETDDYYASTKKINTLINLMRRTVVYRTDALQPNDMQKYMQNAFTIESKNKFGKTIDSAIIAPKKDVNKFHYALLNNQPYLYQLKGDLELSPVLMDWIHEPLMQIDTTQIKRFKFESFEAYRRFALEDLKNVATDTPADFLYGLLSHFQYLTATEIKHAANFSTQNLKPLRNYTITLLNGLIYHIQIFDKDNDYWIAIRLDKEKLITGNVVNFIKENSLFYDGWYFKLNHNIGSDLASFVF